MKAIEAKIRSWSKRANGEVAISIIVHSDDKQHVEWISPGMRMAVGFAEINDDESISQPATEETTAEIAHVLDKPLEKGPPAGVHNPYSRRAGILACDVDYQNYIRAPGEDRASFAASYIRHLCKVDSRKDILPGSEAAALFDREYNDFIIWRDGLKHGAA